MRSALHNCAFTSRTISEEISMIRAFPAYVHMMPQRLQLRGLPVQQLLQCSIQRDGGFDALHYKAVCNSSTMLHFQTSLGSESSILRVWKISEHHTSSASFRYLYKINTFIVMNSAAIQCTTYASLVHID